MTFCATQKKAVCVCPGGRGNVRHKCQANLTLALFFYYCFWMKERKIARVKKN